MDNGWDLSGCTVCSHWASDSRPDTVCDLPSSFHLPEAHFPQLEYGFFRLLILLTNLTTPVSAQNPHRNTTSLIDRAAWDTP